MDYSDARCAHVYFITDPIQVQRWAPSVGRFMSTHNVN
jgi:hypothetical protein